MEWWWQVAVIAGMFVLRLGVPLAITLLVGYWLRRLDAKWQAEAEARWQASQLQPEPVQSPLLNRLNQPCWVTRGCDEAQRALCPATQNPHLPCWLVRRYPNGRLLEPCYTCQIFLYGQMGRSLAHQAELN